MKNNQRLVTFNKGELMYQGRVCSIIDEHIFKMMTYSWLTGEEYSIVIVDLRKTPTKFFKNHAAMLHYLENIDA